MICINNMISKRLGGTNYYTMKKNYKFSSIKKAKDEAQKKNPHISMIDMGIGEPDLPANIDIVNILKKEAGKTENRLYADNGILEFQESAKAYLENVYGLKELDPQKNILHGIGAKSILSMLPLCFINPGDIVITTVPGYPVLSTHTKYLGGDVYNVPLLKENNYYPNLWSIPNNILDRTKLLYINYPNNPTGQIATIDFYEDVLKFACENEIIIVNDAAYAPLVYDGEKPLSFLSVDGAINVGVEVHSLSKAFNMTGWRLGFIVGNEKIIDLLGNVKANTDSGQFRAIQKAGIYALNHPEISENISKKYSRRFDLLIKALRDVGFDVDKPKGTFYCYAPIPKGTKNGITFNSAEEASQYIISNALISTVPWDDAGLYLRFSVTFEAENPEEEKKIIEELKNRLIKLQLVF